MLSEAERSSLSALIEAQISRRHYPSGFPPLPDIPSARYTDAGFYRLELERVFKTGWLYAAHETEIAAPGDYKLFDRMGQSVIVCRDKGGMIRAFHNTCRHRGSAILTQPKGKIGRFVCPYHAWSYALDGGLAIVPEAFNFAGLNKASLGLAALRCEAWRGLIFINFGDDPCSLLDFLGAIPRQASGFPLERLEFKAAETIRVDCNWKALKDNFLEAYHIKSVHPQTVAPWANPESNVMWNYRGGHAKQVTLNPQHRIVGEHRPLPAGTDPLFKDHLVTIFIQPNLQFTLDTGGFSILHFYPDGAVGKALLEITLVGWKDAEQPAPPGYWDALMKNLMVITGEDVRLLNSIQNSMSNGSLKSIKVGFSEKGIYWYHEALDRTIGIKRIPKTLRVEQVMAPDISE